MIPQQLVSKLGSTKAQVAAVVIKIEDGEDRLDQGRDQQVRWKEQFLLVANEDERHAHPARIDRCSLVRGETDYHGSVGLEVAPDVDGEYDLLVPSG